MSDKPTFSLPVDANTTTKAKLDSENNRVITALWDGLNPDDAQAAATSAAEAKASEDAAAASETAAQDAESGAETARTQAELAATAAGATLYDSIANGLAGTTDGDVFLVATEPGVQVYRNDTGSETFLGWLGDVLFDDLPALVADDGSIAVGTIIRTRKEGFAYQVKPGGTAKGATGYHISTAGGVLLAALPAADGSYNVLQFGAKGDSTGVGTGTDDLEAFEIACDMSAGPNDAVPRIWVPIPANGYRFSGPLNLKKIVHLSGVAPCGQTTKNPIRIYVDNGEYGLIVNRHNTLGTGLDPSGSTTGAEGSIVEHLVFWGGGSGDACGVWLRARAVFRDVHALFFPAHGFKVLATSGGADHREGNANLFRLEYCTGKNNEGDGLYIEGADVNAGNTIGFNGVDNGGWGIHDSSFLGNTHVAPHVSGNGYSVGVTDITQANPGVVTTSAAHGLTTGDIVLISGVSGMTEVNNEVFTATVLTDTTFELGENTSGYTAYSSGGAVQCAGSYWMDGANQKSVLIGPYAESGGGFMFLGNRCVAALGLIAVNRKGGGLYLNGRVIGGAAGFEVGSDSYTNLRIGSPGDRIFRAVHADHGSDTFELLKSSAGYVLQMDSVPVMQVIWGGQTTRTCGRSSPIDENILFPFGAFLGTSNAARHVNYGSAAPTSGEYGRGDITFSSAAAASGKAGWICTTAGTAGSTAVFKEFGAIDA